ncbi:MAG: 16S rRNA (guanine(527)-N(7))-methyltransferase RsmG [Rhizobiaceae bacterium]|nr:16S rRNA (guanine(527)-N(7))-methyltransferase RsmG [Rhizobiaceae bacterium]
MNSDQKAQLERIAGPVSRETFDRLKGFEALFGKWAARINLAAPSTLPQLWDRHILDSAQILPLAPAAQRWLDLGSGGGFPGAVLAILLHERPGASIALVESNNKKAAFLRNALAQAGAPASVHPVRIEDFGSQKYSADVVTARALAPLSALLGLAGPWLTEGAKGLFHKGRDYRREVEESRDAWQFDLVEHPSAIDAASVILEISGLKKR